MQVLDYDPGWPAAYRAESARLLRAATGRLLRIEHIGSTAIPGLRAKPVIDIMAATATLSAARSLLPRLMALGYAEIATGMPMRLFLSCQRGAAGLACHLHLVEATTWADRHERHFRDHLIANPDNAAAYGALKTGLAALHADDADAYARAKTGFVQGVMDAVCDARGWPRRDVWADVW